jgi:ankyrin repeat protein
MEREWPMAFSKRPAVVVAAAAAMFVWGQDASLIDAVKAGDRATALARIKRPGAVNAREADGTTALHWAVRTNDLALTQALLRAGADAKAANRYGVTPLSLAVINGNAAMVDSLLKAGPAEKTILMTAARAGNPAVMRLLLARSKADVNARESAYGETALMRAAAENHAEAAQLLIEHGADINARSQLMTYPKDRFGLEGVISILPHGQWTPLMYAARQGSLGALRVLVKAGADLNVSDPDGTTALVFAIINSHYDAARLLVESGANPNLADTAGMAALYAAVDVNTLGEIYGRPGKKVVNDSSALDLVNVLLAHGADPNAPLKSAALYRAHTPGEPTLGEGATPLMRAAKNGDVATMRLLLEHGADPSLRQKNGTTALMLAAGLGRGLNVFAGDYASDAQMVDAVRVLLARHVEVNAVNENGQTAVHFAALSMDAVVRLLAENGADLSIKDKNGRTALDFAMGGGGRGRGGAAPAVRQETAALIRELMNKR